MWMLAPAGDYNLEAAKAHKMGAEGEVTGFLMVCDTSVYLFDDSEESNLRHTRWQSSVVFTYTS